MYYCEQCNKLSEPRVGQYKKVVEKRERDYVSKMREKIKVTKGWEIVKELLVCRECSGE